MSKSMNFVSIDVIANKIYQNPLLKDVNFDQIIDGVVSVLKILRQEDVYEINACYVEVKNFKGMIKAPFLTIETVDRVEGQRLIPMVVSNSHNAKTMNMNKSRGEVNSNVYKINNRMIHTGFQNGRVFVTFKTLILDEDGHPMIPDSEALIRAICSFIKAEVYNVMVDIGKVTENALQRALRDYYFEIGQASSEFKDFDNVDDMESFIRDWTRPVQLVDTHHNRANTTSTREYVRILNV